MNEILNNPGYFFDHLHFVRADWFYAFIPLILFLLLSLKKTLDSKNWQSVVDPQLMPHVLSRSDTTRQRRYPLLLVFIAASLCITALAGPVYKKLPQPVYREQSSLVVLLDLSQSMNATDIKPSRLARARLELLDILKTRKTGQTALVVYAADAFVVTPLTDDNATIANLVPSLETDMMPAQGSNLATALDKALSLFRQSGIVSGDILLITDDVHRRELSAIENIAAQEHRLSIFGIGTASGAPVPLQDGGFLLDRDGAIVIPKLDAEKLQRFALSGGGLYTGILADDSDTGKLSRLFQSSDIKQETDDKKLDADIWQEEGHWLLLPLVFFAALWARKGWIAAVLPFFFSLTLSLPQPAHADADAGTEDNFIDTENLWSSPDQKAMRAFKQGDHKTAAEQFSHPEWKASAYYRDGDYEETIQALQNSNSSDAYYNKGNALARLGKFQEAIEAYDRAIELNENNQDAKYNREQVKQALEKQQQEQKNDQQQDGSDQDSEANSDNDQEQGEQQQKDQQSQQQDSQSREQQNQDQQGQDQQEQKSDQSSEQSPENQQNEQAQDDRDQQQAEEQQLKQRDAEAEKKQQEQEKQQYEQEQKDKDEPQQADKEQQTQPDEVEHADSEEKPAEVEINPMEASITEEEKATEQWLKRIPDDPGGLLRRKFYYQYKQQPNQTDDNEPW